MRSDNMGKKVKTRLRITALLLLTLAFIMAVPLAAQANTAQTDTAKAGTTQAQADTAKAGKAQEPEQKVVRFGVFEGAQQEPDIEARFAYAMAAADSVEDDPEQLCGFYESGEDGK